MLVSSNVTMQFGSKPLFENISVKFGGGNRYGLIGANGSGKSTFMKAVAINVILAQTIHTCVAKNVKMPPEMERQMARTSLRSILKQVAKSITPADVQQLNAALNKIKKES